MRTAVLFDLDGTLLDTLQDLGDAMNRVLTVRGYPTHPLELYKYFVGEGVLRLVTRVLPEDRRTPELVQDCVAAFREDYAKNYDVATRPYAGIPEMLDALAARGVRLAILSNKPHAHTAACVSRLLSRWTFEVVLGMRQGVPAKPDPHAALEAAERMRATPSECLFLGDSGIDMRTANASGMFAVGCLWGFRAAEELQEGGARALIARPMQVLDYLDDALR